MRTFLTAFGIGTIVLIVAYTITGAIMGRTELLAAVFGPVEREQVDFATLIPRGTPNEFLACPAKTCATTPHARVPVFAMPVDDLRARVLEIAAARPRLTLLSHDVDVDQYEFEERSALFAFPDAMSVRLFAVDDETSTVAVYSRSHYGRGDLGVNEARVRGWLEALAE